MSLGTDICEWCGSKVDSIVRDIKKPIPQANWCGNCLEGRNALYSRVSVQGVTARLRKLRRKYDGDPIAYDGPDQPTEADEMLYRERLGRQNHIFILEQVLRDRGHLV